jgi:hypothetical protein
LAVATLLTALLAAGCSTQSRPPDTAAEPPRPEHGEAAGLPHLPDWAPEEPSPELVRAAKVLRPLPSDAHVAVENAAEHAAQIALIRDHFYPRTWELFGSLSDAQIEELVLYREVSVPVAEMTGRQMTVFRRLLDDWRDLTIQGQQCDLEVMLYKAGAREDLSNVAVGFVTSRREEATHMVLLIGEVRHEGGPETLAFGAIAQM